ncbi:hypothetical protein PF005_g3126 [Phytophthora fragariae]|uniref:Uncharacterized protein n=1 Tax=Phytophthora fragariae TaxID=53985 RepID=A0A6A3F5D4_9STRA|nr:hypothetical protein PF003_g39148 [Phytophthora fragariae]KAE8938920.1 hypothetical protein PF009_g11228 [Phytophthora fragariae]KAE9017431.1 hypothetical protein PF011_g6695 [Phytophthora fragariae]KAE9120349.1 hypothetical protein PF007_g8193 [Phytophthora fragariae]KAE9120687.1 hypothetical protein PF010_g7395 [Phytophthora fragariae]
MALSWWRAPLASWRPRCRVPRLVAPLILPPDAGCVVHTVWQRQAREIGGQSRWHSRCSALVTWHGEKGSCPEVH